MNKPNVAAALRLPRGETLVASVGIAVAAIVVGVTVASAWLAEQQARDALFTRRAAVAQQVADTLGPTLESLLAAGDLSAARRAVREAGAAFDLSRCRVEVAGGILAAEQADAITLAEPPATWVAKAAVADRGEGEAGAVTARLDLPGKGTATLVVATNAPSGPAASMAPGYGLAVVSGLGLLAVWWVYRRMRLRLRSIAAIRESLLELDRLEHDATALRVADHWGEEARRWNQLLDQHDRLRQQLASSGAAGGDDRRGQGGQDMGWACDSLACGMVVIDDDGRIGYANGAAAVFFQTGRDELFGEPVQQYLHDPRVHDAVAAALDPDVRRRSTIEATRAAPADDAEADDAEAADDSGEHGRDHDRAVLRYSIRPTRASDQLAAVIVIEDITQQRAAEEARHAFVSQATHELRAPLTNIRLYVEMALDDGEHDEAIRGQALNVINTESKRLEQLVADMLSVAEIEAGAMSLEHGDVRLDAFFKDVEQAFAATARAKGIELRFDLPPKLPVIRGDRDKLMLAAQNLVGNAVKYTPSGGQVTVEVTDDEAHVQMAVTDTGIGIDPKAQAKVFDKFYRANDPRVGEITGSGLGLALSREVVRLHGGDIGVESQLDRGSTFTMTIPLSQRSVLAAAA